MRSHLVVNTEKEGASTTVLVVARSAAVATAWRTGDVTLPYTVPVGTFYCYTLDTDMNTKNTYGN